MAQSEVAQLRQRITEEYEAMKYGLSGLAYGTTKHAFIDARMKRVDAYYDQLTRCIGAEEATQVVCELYIEVIG